jgi:glycosyltransferase involved in cell wall biosynthesis
MGMPRERITVLRNGVDLAQFKCLPQDESRRQLRWREAPTLLCVGNLIESKGTHLVIEALPLLPQFELRIVGSGPQEDALQRLAQRCGVAGRVHFCGRIAQDELCVYYSAADMLVLASEREGAPNVVLESMACGTPVVAAAVGGIPELVQQPATGRLLQARSAQAVAAAVRDLHEHPVDRRAVRTHASRFGWGETTRALGNLFAALASRSRAAAPTPAGADCRSA